MIECLEALAIAHHDGNPARAAVLLGGATALRESIGAPLLADEQAEQAHFLDSLRAELGDPAFDVAWHDGRLLGLDEMLRLAVTNR